MHVHATFQMHFKRTHSLAFKTASTDREFPTS